MILSQKRIFIELFRVLWTYIQSKIYMKVHEIRSWQIKYFGYVKISYTWKIKDNNRGVEVLRLLISLPRKKFTEQFFSLKLSQLPCFLSRHKLCQIISIFVILEWLWLVECVYVSSHNTPLCSVVFHFFVLVLHSLLVILHHANELGIVGAS